MDATTHPHGTPETHHPDEHGHEHHELGFIRKYIFSTDHKVIGIQYGISGLLFLFFGFCLMMMMRWQLAYPGQAMPPKGVGLPIPRSESSPTPARILIHFLTGKLSGSSALFF